MRTLERHRVAGTGPRFCRLGRLVRYRECDLDDWVSRSLRTSTSEIPESAPQTAKLTSEERVKQSPSVTAPPRCGSSRPNCCAQSDLGRSIDVERTQNDFARDG